MCAMVQKEVLGKWPEVSALIAGVREAQDWGPKACRWNEVGCLPACLPACCLLARGTMADWASCVA